MRVRTRLSGLWFALVAVLFGGCAGRTRPAVSPPLRVLPLHEISEYSHATAPEIYLRTAQDVLPGGLAAAMVPVLVDWDAFDPAAEDSQYVIRNLNAGGNPLGGTTVLRSARIPARGIRRVEFVLVPLDDLGLVAHGMLRFVFDDSSPGALLGPNGDENGQGAAIPDLILSWEAWRPPGVDFDFIKGMDPDAFGLSLRAYTGPQRFLEDALGDRGWEAYELDLPGGRQGNDELLYDTLVLGDGTGRQVLAEIFSQELHDWLASAPESGDDPAATKALRDELLEQVSEYRHPDDARLELEPSQRNYQTMLRSCATMALYCINVATERLLQRGLGKGRDVHPTAPAVMQPVSKWMTEMAHMTALEMFLLAPRAVGYLTHNATVVPSKIPDALRDSGLLAGEGHATKFSLKEQTPYGDLQSILIR